MTNPNSAIIFEGKSKFDQKPVVAIATGFNATSNKKIGNNTVQVWVLRQDDRPTQIVADKQDVSVCGNCPLKHNVCYVSVPQAPTSIYAAYQRNSYTKLSDHHINKMRDQQKVLRLTAYGDLAAIGIEPVKRLISAASKVLGYTHQWQTKYGRYFKGFLMASVHNVKDAKKAQAQGWKTFRIKSPDEPLIPGEIICPNQLNMNIQCQTCQLCDGRTVNVAIDLHGLNWKLKNFAKL